jgi:hypothetical protein
MADMPLTKREAARRLLDELFSGRRRVPISEAVERSRDLGVSRRTLQRASRELGVHEVHGGRYESFWEKDT